MPVACTTCGQPDCIPLPAEMCGACANVVCDDPPSACHDPAGTCVLGECTYALRTGSCDDGDACTVLDACAAGACLGQPRTCTAPPPTCDSSSVRRFATGDGTCNPDGSCAFTFMTETCVNGCTDGFCAGDPCVGVTCNMPTSPCHAPTGTCSNGTCSYALEPGRACNDGDSCTSDDRCTGGGSCRGTTSCSVLDIRISELQTRPVTSAFIELWAAPGTSLAGYKLVRLWDDGTDAESLDLSGSTDAVTGLFVVAHPQATGALAMAADMQHPMAAAVSMDASFQVRLGNAVVDALAAGTFASPRISSGEGRPAPAPASGNSVARDGLQADTGDNLADFTERTGAQVTPGTRNPGGNLPPTARITCPSNVVTGQMATLDASASTDADGTLVRFTFDPGDGSSPVGQVSATRSHTWTNAGMYTVTVVVEDNGGATASASCVTNVTVPPNALPVASLSCPTTATVGVAVTLDGSGSTDSDGTITRYTFTPGDGAMNTSGTASSIMHTYTTVGMRTAQLLVEDNRGGMANASCTINVQDAACVPEDNATFCTRVARNCGRVTANDNCGMTRTVPDCGSCAWPQTCGGGNTDGVCAAGCGWECPPGFACNGQGACGGGDLANVRWDVRVHTVSGSVQLNGATPTTTCTGSATPKATITFESTRNGSIITRDIGCGSSSFNFTASLPRDVYKVTVRGRHATTPGDRTNLPSDPFLARTELAVTGDLTNQVLNVRTGSISGTVRVNGATATNPATCSGNKATVSLVGATHGGLYSVNLLCGTTSFAYSIPNVLADTYRVVVTGLLPTSAATNVPQAAYTHDTAKLIESALTAQTLDVKTANITGSQTTTGSIRVNGAIAVNQANCSGTNNPTAVKARAILRGVTHDKDYAWDVLCNVTTFSVPMTSILQGEYEMLVEGFADANGAPFTNVPVGSPIKVGNRTFTADTTGVRWEHNTFTLTARTRFNATTTFPANAGSCAGTGTVTKARIRIIGDATGYDRARDIPCSSITWLADFGAVPADTYRMLAMGVSGNSTLPNEPYVAQEAYALTANTTNLNLVVRTASVGGRVYLDDAIPTSGPGTCSGATPRVAITFAGALHGAQYVVNIPCNSSMYAFPATTMLQDTYRVTLAGLAVSGMQLSALPAHPYVAQEALVIAADNTTLRLDVFTRMLDGQVYLDGANPTTTCSNPANKADVRLTGTRHGQQVVDTIRCGESFRAQFTLYPDSYVVDVRGLGAAATNLPDTWVPVTRLLVP